LLAAPGTSPATLTFVVVALLVNAPETPPESYLRHFLIPRDLIVIYTATARPTFSQTSNGNSRGQTILPLEHHGLQLARMHRRTASMTLHRASPTLTPTKRMARTSNILSLILTPVALAMCFFFFFCAAAARSIDVASPSWSG